MDNERQVKFVPEDVESSLITVRAKEWFLKAARDFAKAQERYNLNSEFAKSKESRSLLVPVTVIATVLVLGGGAFWLTQVYSQSQNRVEVGSQEFENVDLREILDRYRKLDSERLYQEDLIQGLINQEESLAQRARVQNEDKISLVRGANLDKEEETRRVSALENTLKRELAQIRSSSKSQRSAPEKTRDELKAQIDAIDKEKLNRALALEVVLSGERMLFDQEMNRTRSAHDQQISSLKKARTQELKERGIFIRTLEAQAREVLAAEKQRLVNLYNPVYSNPQEKALLERVLSRENSDNFRVEIPQGALATGVVSPQDWNTLESELQDLKTLYFMIARTPYVNDVPPLLTQLSGRTLAAVEAALKPSEKLGFELDQAKKHALELEQKTLINQVQAELLNSLSAGYAQTASRMGQQALVIWADPNDQSQIRGYFQALQNAKIGQRFYVSRKDSVPLGEYELITLEGAYALLRRQNLNADLQSRLGRLDQKLRVINPGDWLVPKDTYRLP